MTTARTLFEFDDSYAREVPGLSVPWTAAPVPAPELLVLNEELAAELGVDAAALREPAGVALLVGHGLPDGVTPVAQAYAGHQFGRYVPRLGDGRALLLGEVIDTAGRRRDLHLKGSGRTPFARGGRRQGRGRPDAARVPDRRGDARPRHPDDAGARRRGHRRAGAAREGGAAGRGALPGRGQPPARRHVPVRRRDR